MTTLYRTFIRHLSVKVFIYKGEVMITYLVHFVKGEHEKIIKIKASTKEEAKKIGTSMCKEGTVVSGYKVQGEPQTHLSLPHEHQNEKLN